MPKKPINREDAFAADEAEETEMPAASRPRMPMDEANAVMDGVFPTTPYVSPKKLLEEQKARNEQLEALVAQLQQQGASGLAVQNGNIIVGDFQLTPTGLVAPENFTEESWQEVGLLLLKLEGSIQWLLGDWIVYGGQVGWGDLPELAKALGRDYGSLRNFASTSRSVDLSLRSDKLSYNHHVLVAPYTPEEQAVYLGYAAIGEEKPLSVARFRAWIKEQRGEVPVLPSGDENVFDIDVVTRDLKKFMHTDPDKLKPKQFQAVQTEIQRRIRELNQITAHLRQRWNIDD